MSEPLDLDALRVRYAEERNKRLRTDGIAQYQSPSGHLAAFADDPNADPSFTRDPCHATFDVALIGAGLGGLLAGARLRELGVERICLVDKGAEVGGTWYFNRYPGLACDIESYVYLPLLEELAVIPSAKYVPGEEILEHCRRIADHYDLRRDALLQTTVQEVRWDESDGHWVITTDRNDQIRARFVAMANGYLHRPKLPGIPGIDRFRGHMFHTSRWDYGYTGGDANTTMNRLHDQSVAVIGTGASAIQCIPHLARDAQRLFVFQRTPSTVAARDNAPTDPTWAADLEPGWQRRRIENFQLLTAGGWSDQDLVADGWTDITRKLLTAALAPENADLDAEALRRIRETADMARMREIRARVDELVDDPATAEVLKPWYGYFCKRPCFHDDYLQTFNRSNVTLVDTHGRGVDAITERGVVVGDTEYPVDCIVFATGFEVGTEYSRRAGFEVIGRKGRTLTEHWDDGARTLHSLHVNGFPNCFVVSTTQAGLTVNFPYLLDLQAHHVAWIVATATERGYATVEARTDAEQEWVDTIVARVSRMSESASNCTPGYYNLEGQADERTRQGTFFFGEPTEFADLLAAWRDAGDFAGLDCIPLTDTEETP